MEYYPVDIIPEDMSIKEAWEIIRDKGHTLLPVSDESGLFKGIVSVSDITQTYMSLMGNDFLEKYNVNIKSIVENLGSRILYGQELLDHTAGKLCIYHNITWNDAVSIKHNDIILVAGNISSVIESMEYASNYIFVVGNLKDKDEDVLAQYAKIKHKAIIQVGYDLLSVIRLISQCISVKEIMKTKKIIHFHENEYIDEIRDIMIESRHRYFPVIDYNGKAVGTISRKQLLTYRKKKVVLIDHNEMSQTVKGIDQAEILEILDHHRLGDIQTRNPIFVRNLPVGSSSTIIANMYFEKKLQPDKDIAGILCAAIISDTLLFKSPTCTEIDVDTAQKLAEIAGIDIKTFGYEMLKAGASIVKKTPKEILLNDIKEYNLGKYKFSISQINTMDLNELDGKREQLREIMKEKAENEKYDAVILIVTDLLKQGSELICEGPETDRVKMAFGMNEDLRDETKGMGNQPIFLQGVVSRKKQIIPRLAMNIDI
ncbi:MAG: manganese-dependent inorganic pyrophosphatase [Clostridiales bacterium]|nr:manganese-dependent inorganic pyrophosphatase [Clostridiales bacterium]